MTDQERIIFEQGFEEGYTVAKRIYERIYEGMPMVYSKWLEHGKKYKYLEFYNKQNEKQYERNN